MSKIGVKVGFTYRVGPLDTNQYGRMDVEVHDIETDLPIDKQLEEAGLAINKVYDHILEKVDSEIEKIISMTTEQKK